jgi:hypothetical protein
MSEQTSLNLSTNRAKLETNSPAAQETAVNVSVPQTHTPFPVSNRTVMDVCSYTKQHSKGLLTPCRQVGLSRKSPRNSVSPSTIDIHPSSTPKRLRFFPSLRNSKGLGKFNVNVFDTHTHEEETPEVLGKRINLENINENAKQYRHEMQAELICNKRDEGTKEEKQTGNVNNNSQHSSIGVLSCTVSDIQGNLNDECNMGTESVDGVMSTEKTQMGNVIGAQDCSVDYCKTLGFKSISSNDANSVIISTGTNGETAIKANQVKNLDTPTQQFHVYTPFHKDSNLLSNSSNEDSLIKSGSMIECTEQNFKILKQQITDKEEEVKQLKLILLYKKKVIQRFNSSVTLSLVHSFLTFGIRFGFYYFLDIWWCVLNSEIESALRPVIFLNS